MMNPSVGRKLRHNAIFLVTCLALFASQSTLAQCTPDQTLDENGDDFDGIVGITKANTTVTCIGAETRLITTDPDPLKPVLGPTNVSVNILPGATVSGSDVGPIFLNGFLNSVSNAGTVTASGFDVFGVSIDGGGAIIINTGTMTISGTDAAAIGINGASGGVTNSGTITVTGSDTTGVEVNGNGTNVANSGTITINGGVATGVGVVGDSTVLTNTGTIDMNGAISVATGAFGDGTNMTNSNVIDTDGNTALGMGAIGQNLTITNAGGATITTRQSGSHGMFLGLQIIPPLNILIPPAVRIPSQGTLTNGGTITTLGDGAQGIHGLTNGGTVDNTGTVSTAGMNANGIEIQGSIDAINNTGSITTTLDTSIGIHVTGDASSVTNGNALAPNDSEGLISTRGANAHGIKLDKSSALAGTVRNAGNISTSGMSADGVQIAGTGNGVAVTNLRNITTSGQNAVGVRLDGRNSLVNGVDGGAVGSAQIITTNTGAHGVFLDTDSTDLSEGVDATIVNFGTITTGGIDAHAVNLLAVDTTFINQGNLDATGAGFGVFIQGGRTGSRTTTINGQNLPGAGIVIRNSGQIQATGAGLGIVVAQTPGVTIENFAGGIIAGISLGGDAAKIVNEGIINRGISDINNESGVDNRIEIINQAGATINSQSSALLSLPSELTFLNDGDINVTGLNTSGGIVVGVQDLFNLPAPGDLSRTNDVTITNTGTLTVDGTIGILVGANTTATVNNSGQITAARGIAGIGDGTFNFTNSGTINTTGVVGKGIDVLFSANANISNSGTIQTSGANAAGIVAVGSSTISVSNGGSIATIGADAMGIRTLLGGGLALRSTNIINGGVVNTSGARAHGIWATDGPVTINNTGGVTVDGANASAVFVDTGATPVTLNLTNSGTLSAPGTAVSASTSDDVVNNTGTIQGAVLLFGGVDRVTLQDSSDFQGLVDGGDGTDTLVASIASAKILNGSNFVNFEDFTKNGAGTLALAGHLDLGATASNARIQDGRVTMAPTSVLTAKLTSIAPGATLVAAGTIIGDVQNDGTIAPGQSPGILDIFGDLIIGSSGRIEVEIGGLAPGLFDQLAVSGSTLFLGGAAIDFMFIDGFAPRTGDTFDFLSTDSVLGDITQIDFNIFGLQSGFQFDVGLGGSGLIFKALNDGVSAVPLPPTVWLFVAGLASLLGTMRKRRQLAGKPLCPADSTESLQARCASSP